MDVTPIPIPQASGYNGATNEGGSGAGETAPSRGQHLCGGAVMAHVTCSVDGCEARARSRGWCNLHYKRWLKHGDPLLVGWPESANPRAPRGGAYPAFLEMQARQTDDCVLWPYSTNGVGYGSLQLGGRTVTCHRLSCEIAHGLPPTPSHEVAHSCRNRHCLNPRHLRWATHAENMTDRITDGTHDRGERNVNAKLTEAAVRVIRRHPHANRSVIGAWYGVSPASISGVLAYKTWAWV